MNTHNVVIPVVSTVARSTSSLQCLQTRDIDEHARNMPGWQVRYDQLSPGAFAGELIEFRSDWMQLARDRSNQAMIKNGAAWKGAITFSLPLSAQGPLYCSGHPIHDHSLLVAHGEHLPELHTPQHLDLLSVAIDECVLERILERQGSHFRITDLPKCYRLGHSPMQPALSALFDELASCAHPRNALLEHEALHRSIRDTVMLHILDLIAPEQAPSLTPTARKRVVDRAREYALNHLDEPFSAGLAAAGQELGAEAPPTLWWADQPGWCGHVGGVVISCLWPGPTARRLATRVCLYGFSSRQC